MSAEGRRADRSESFALAVVEQQLGIVLSDAAGTSADLDLATRDGSVVVEVMDLMLEMPKEPDDFEAPELTHWWMIEWWPENSVKLVKGKARAVAPRGRSQKERGALVSALQRLEAASLTCTVEPGRWDMLLGWQRGPDGRAYGVMPPEYQGVLDAFDVPSQAIGLSTLRLDPPRGFVQFLSGTGHAWKVTNDAIAILVNEQIECGNPQLRKHIAKTQASSALRRILFLRADYTSGAGWVRDVGQGLVPTRALDIDSERELEVWVVGNGNLWIYSHPSGTWSHDRLEEETSAQRHQAPGTT